jgi:hypothetical protein
LSEVALTATKFLKHLTLFFFPFPGGIAGVVEGSGDVREVLYKSAVEIHKANKLLYFLL